MNRTHGLRRHRLYSVWRNIKTRCYNPKTHNYYCYGGKGITMCDEWVNNVDAFFKWCMDNGYDPKLTIDRIDSNKGYSPDNCRFTTRHIQQANRSFRRKKNNYQGVHKCGKFFIARISVNGEKHYLGSFISDRQAAIVRDEYIIDSHLMGYKLNFNYYGGVRVDK